MVLRGECVSCEHRPQPVPGNLALCMLSSLLGFRSTQTSHCRFRKLPRRLCTGAVFAFAALPDAQFAQLTGGAPIVITHLRCCLADDQCSDPAFCLHGTCTSKGGNGTCVCSIGWTGLHCDEPTDFCVVDLCGDHGKCNKANGLCVCDLGWSGTLCSTPPGKPQLLLETVLVAEAEVPQRLFAPKTTD